MDKTLMIRKGADVIFSSAWISVKDRLPGNCMSKIVFSAGFPITIMYYDTANGTWVDRIGFEHSDIDFWMELPEPPE